MSPTGISPESPPTSPQQQCHDTTQLTRPCHHHHLRSYHHHHHHIPHSCHHHEKHLLSQRSNMVDSQYRRSVDMPRSKSSDFHSSDYHDSKKINRDLNCNVRKHVSDHPSRQEEKYSRTGSKSSESNSRPSYGSSRGSYWGSSQTETTSDVISHSVNHASDEDDDVFPEDLIITSSSSSYAHTNLTKLAKSISSHRLLRNGATAYPVPPLNFPPSASAALRRQLPTIPLVKCTNISAHQIPPRIFWTSEEEEHGRRNYNPRNIWLGNFPGQFHKLFHLMSPHGYPQTFS